MGMAFDYYNDLEDKLFGHIITQADLNDTVNTDNIIAQLSRLATDIQNIHSLSELSSFRDMKKIV